MKPRICFVGPMLGCHPGRIPNPAEELFRQLSIRQYTCYLVSTKLNRYHRLFDILYFILKNRKNIDVLSVQVFSGPSFVIEDLVSIMAKRLKLPFMMVLWGGAMLEFMSRYPRWVKRVLQRTDYLFTPSHYLSNGMKTSGIHVDLLPYGMAIQHYPFKLRQGKIARLVWARAFHAIYQPEMAVQVVSKLIKEFPEINLKMVGPSYGDGSLENTRKLISRLGLEKHIQIVGYVPKSELPAMFQSEEIFLNTTKYESFGITVMEAAACGLPIVTTNVGELAFLWQNEQNAMTVDMQDVDGMADAVRKLLTNSSLAQRLSKAARQNAEQYDWSQVLPLWERLFKELMEG